jgi:hypothetical protein
MLQIARQPDPFPAAEEDGPFRFDQLSERAKERARDHYREHALEYDWWDYTYGDADTIAALLGINILTHDNTRGRSPRIYFTGFWSQGDGACFDGNWAPATNDVVADIAAHAPEDERLAEIAEDFAGLNARAKGHNVCASARQHGHYSHSGCTVIDVNVDLPDHALDWNEFQRMTYEAVRKHDLGPDFETEVTAALRSFMDWIYHRLEEEYEYLTSDEAVDDALADDEFDEDGDRI